MHRIKLTITCKIFDTTSISRWNDHLSYKHIPRTNVLKSEKVVFPNFDRNAWVVAGFFCGFLSWFELMWVWVDLIQSCLPFPSGSTVNKWQRCFAAIDHFPSFSSRLKFYRVICRVKNRWIYFAQFTLRRLGWSTLQYAWHVLEALFLALWPTYGPSVACCLESCTGICPQKRFWF